MNIPFASKFKDATQKLTAKQRQFAMLGAIMACGVGALWAVFTFTGDSKKPAGGAQSTNIGAANKLTNIGVMAPGAQVNPVDQWVGTAGKKLAQYDNDREEQARINRERKNFEDKTMQRFTELEHQLITVEAKPAQPTPPAIAPVNPQPSSATTSPANPTNYPPAGALVGNLPPPRVSGNGATPLTSAIEPPELAGLIHVALINPGKAARIAGPVTTPAKSKESDTVQSFLPVSFTRGTLLGGLDAPTGGQSQSNPHPVLIRLSDNSVLPNRMRAGFKDCFVIAAGYGDISSERAYLRTENLSCVREDGSTLEVRIQGTIYGEDGKVGMRGRLVTKQGQMLANALLAGLISGLGQGLATSGTSTSTSALGTIASTSGSSAYRAGLGSGMGSALDRLAQYYIKLAEQTFPVIEVDAGREIDVVITKGVRIEAPATASVATDNLAPTTSFTSDAVDSREASNEAE